MIPDPEAVLDVDVHVGLRGSGSKGLEILDGEAVFVDWISKDNDIDGLLLLL